MDIEELRKNGCPEHLLEKIKRVGGIKVSTRRFKSWESIENDVDYLIHELGIEDES